MSESGRIFVVEEIKIPPLTILCRLFLIL